jgi:hypothetical protein
MKLLTKEIEKKLPALYSRESGCDDPRFVVKFFDPIGSWTWYVLEGEKQEDGDWLFYGLVDGMEKEWGYFRLSELESIANTPRHSAFQLGIERDIHFSNEPTKNYV